MSENESLSQYFVSNYIDNESLRQNLASDYVDIARDIKQTVRRMSFPFLRRCALLWKLMNSSALSPFGGASLMDYTYGTAEEFVEIEDLEKMFKIDSLDNIVNDELSRSLVLNWLHHFAREYEVNTPSRGLHLTPVVPFKLMVLPHLYQDLLQRFFLFLIQVIFYFLFYLHLFYIPMILYLQVHKKEVC